MKSSTVISTQTLLLTFGIVLVLSLFFFIIWPWIMGMIQGQCWSNAKQTMNSMSTGMGNIISGKSGRSQEFSVVLGDCVKEYVIADDLSASEYGCVDDYSSFIGIKPSTKWYQFFKQMTLKAECRKIPCGSGLSCNIVGKSITLKGPKAGSSESYCISITKDSDKSYLIENIDLSEC